MNTAGKLACAAESQLLNRLAWRSLDLPFYPAEQLQAIDGRALPDLAGITADGRESERLEPIDGLIGALRRVNCDPE
jgi:hypothetical protein